MGDNGQQSVISRIRDARLDVLRRATGRPMLEAWVGPAEAARLEREIADLPLVDGEQFHERGGDDLICTYNGMRVRRVPWDGVEVRVVAHICEWA